MKMAVIDPTRKLVSVVDYPDVHAAMPIAGLRPGGVDFGAIDRLHHLCVYEFGLFDPPETTRYFALAGRLYAGNAVFFQCDEQGETCDLEDLPNPLWFDNLGQIEVAMKLGLVQRPKIAVNDGVMWQWPDQDPHQER